MSFKKMRILLKLWRVDNWTKNVLIIFPCFFGKMITDIALLFDIIIAATIFCLITSCVYIINDLADAPLDSLHPVKKNRPIAAGDITPTSAIIILCITFCITTTLALIILPKIAIVLLGVYLVLNLLYSFWLKNILIIDIFLIAVFFEIRLIFGGVVASISISHWFVLTVFFLASLIALGKRRDDVMLQEEKEINIRQTSKHYNLLFLDAMIVIMSSLSVFIYIIYSVSDWVVNNFSEYFYISDIFVILCLSKYLYTIFVEKKSGNPIKILLKDRFILICIILWAFSIFYFIYYAKAL